MNFEKDKYTVQKAAREHLDWLCEKKWSERQTPWREKRDAPHCFVALDESGAILGCLLAEDKNIAPPLGGKDWWINHLIVFDPAHRRKGIGSALLKEAISHAKQEGIRHLCGNTVTTRHIFSGKATAVPWRSTERRGMIRTFL